MIFKDKAPLKNKVTIFGAGMVGSTCAYSLVAANITEEIALIDLNEKLVSSQVLDIEHSVPFWGYTKVKAGNILDVADSRIVVITCGSAQKPGETRIDLLKNNAKIVKELLPKIFKINTDAILVMVTNPVDILTNIAVKMYPAKKNQIFGSGTILDSARFRFNLSEKLNVDPKSIHAYIAGEHGDSEVALWSTASVGNLEVDKVSKISKKEKNDIFQRAKNAAYTIIEGKQSTYFAIGAGVVEIVRAVLFDKKTVLPVSHLLTGQYGLKKVCLSIPAIVGKEGIIKTIETDISNEEKKLLKLSAEKLIKAEEEL